MKERDAFTSMNGRRTVAATRHLAPPSRCIATMESTRLNYSMPRINTVAEATTAAKQSKLIAALDALSLNKDDDDDSEVEIVAVKPAAIKPKGARQGNRTKPSLNAWEPECVATHRFSIQDTRSKPRRSNTKENTNLKLASGTSTNNMNTDWNDGHGTLNPPTTTVGTSTLTTHSGPVSVRIPSYSYKDYNPTPTVVYTRHEEEANDLVASLKKGPLGFDMEWRVLWTRKANSTESVAQDRRVAIVQLADMAGMILVIQVFAMSRFPKKLQELIEDPKIPKLGANILNDGNKLLDDYGIVAKNLLELGALVHIADPVGGDFLAGSRSPQWKNIIALAKLVKQYCQKTLEKPKNLRMGNWEAELNGAQVDYAASDAHCAVKVYERLLELAEDNGIPLTDETIQKRCSSSVPYPYRKLSKHPSSSDVQMEGSRGIFGGVRRFATMPNMTATTPVHTSGSAPRMRPQHLRAYNLWYEEGMNLEEMCGTLRLKTNENTGTVSSETTTAPDVRKDEDENKPTTIDGSNSLKPSTVIGYVIGALQTDADLPFDMEKLRDLVQMEGSSWERHHEWLLRVWREGRGVAH